jgi:hypothetical protein
MLINVLCFFFLLTDIKETTESANDPCKSASSDAEDIFADDNEFDIHKVLIYISQIVMLIFCRLCTCESCSMHQWTTLELHLSDW